jgi:hypothetical protein
MAVIHTTDYVHLRTSCPTVAKELISRCLAPLGTSAALARLTRPNGNGTKRARDDETRPACMLVAANMSTATEEVKNRIRILYLYT